MFGYISARKQTAVKKTEMLYFYVRHLLLLFVRYKILLLDFVNAYFLSVLADALEFNRAVNESKESVIGTLADIQTRMDLCASLSYENIARKSKLSVSLFCTETFGLGISAVFGRADTFLMSHSEHLHPSIKT